MWKFLEELAKDAVRYELTTWAGIANVVGFIVILKLSPAVSFTEKAMNRFSTLLEGSRKYRASKRGWLYEPVYREQRPKPVESPRVKTFVSVAGYLVLSVAVIAAVDQVVVNP